MKTILQVEDDPNDVFFLQKAMTKMGVTNPIQIASDGQQAIDYLQGAGKHGDREKFPFPNLVLLDLKLPYVMGLEVLRWIRERRGTGLTVVMLSASAQESDIATAYRLGANAFLSKPSETNKLEEIVKAIKDFWLTHNILPRGSTSEPPVEGVVSLGPVSTIDFAERPPPCVNRMLREIWPHEITANK
jgi:two-component system response regulator